MFSFLNKRAQSTLEYALMIAVVVGALVAMQFYVKRGLQGRLRQSSDEIGEQFSPTRTTSLTTTITNIGSTENVTGGAQPLTSTSSNQRQGRNVSENVQNLAGEEW